VAQLQEKGINVTLNIVGFAIDDDATESQFAEWAEAGGGRYFAATDQAGFGEAVSEALKSPYTVYDQAGERIAEGLVGGEPVTLDRQEPSDRSEGRENRILAGLNRTCEQARRHG